MIETNETLLQRLKGENAQDAWREFYEAYWGAIIRYARKLRLSEAQAQDVLQETMVALIRILPEFAYDRRRGRFRNFLLTIVHRKSLALLRSSRRNSGQPWNESDCDDKVVSMPFDPVGDLEAKHRWREALCEEALSRLRADTLIDERTLAIFEAYVIERRSATEVAETFGVKENAVYQIKNRLVRRLQSEVTRMMRETGMDVEQPLSS